HPCPSAGVDLFPDRQILGDGPAIRLRVDSFENVFEIRITRRVDQCLRVGNHDINSELAPPRGDTLGTHLPAGWKDKHVAAGNLPGLLGSRAKPVDQRLLRLTEALLENDDRAALTAMRR